MRYLVLADRAVPYLLARVRWPDVAQAISAARPDWLDDQGLFDLPYDPGAVTVSFPQAASVAAGWGRQLHAEAAQGAPSYIRRMPANWSDLSPSERRTWGIEFVGRRRAPARRVRGQLPADVRSTPRNGAAERRRHPRVRLDGRAYIRCEQTTISAGLVDLSQGGVRCVLPEAPSPVAAGAKLGGPFLLEVEVDTSRICLGVAGRISWQGSNGVSGHFGVGFGELSADEAEGVQRFLAAAGRKEVRR